MTLKPMSLPMPLGRRMKLRDLEYMTGYRATTQVAFEWEEAVIIKDIIILATGKKHLSETTRKPPGLWVDGH